MRAPADADRIPPRGYARMSRAASPATAGSPPPPAASVTSAPRTRTAADIASPPWPIEAADAPGARGTVAFPSCPSNNAGAQDATRRGRPASATASRRAAEVRPRAPPTSPPSRRRAVDRSRAARRRAARPRRPTMHRTSWSRCSTSAAAYSHHLRKLREAGAFVGVEQRGLSTCSTSIRKRSRAERVAVLVPATVLTLEAGVGVRRGDRRPARRTAADRTASARPRGAELLLNDAATPTSTRRAPPRRSAPSPSSSPAAARSSPTRSTPGCWARSASRLVFGLVIMAMVYATGHLSGAHLNPAVTLAFALTRHFPAARGARLHRRPARRRDRRRARACSPLWPSEAGRSSAPTVPSVGAGSALVYEAVLTAFLMFVIMAVATDTRAVGAESGDRDRRHRRPRRALRRPDHRRLDEPGALARPRAGVAGELDRLLDLPRRPDRRRRDRRARLPARPRRASAQSAERTRRPDGARPLRLPAQRRPLADERRRCSSAPPAAATRAAPPGRRRADRVHPEVVEVMRELGIDLSDRRPQRLTRRARRVGRRRGDDGLRRRRAPTSRASATSTGTCPTPRAGRSRRSARRATRSPPACASWSPS